MNKQATPTVTVPFSGLRQQCAEVRKEIDAAIASVLDAAVFIGGRELEQLEALFAKFCRVRDAIGVSSGFAALQFALWAIGVRSGDEVIVPVNTFIATPEAVVANGARPVFVDVVESTANINPECIRRALTCRTKAIVPVHLYGLPAEMDEILRLAQDSGIAVIEDAAQAHGAQYKGAPVGSLSNAGCFSFYPAKNLGAFGDGGIVTTSDLILARAVRLFRDHGRVSKYEHAVFGSTGRLDNLQAAVVHVQLGCLQRWNSERRKRVEWYLDALPREAVAFRDPRGESVCHIFAIRVPKRDEFQAFLALRGIETAVHYPVPLHLQPACRDMGYRPGDFPVAERLAAEIVSLPVHPFLTHEEVLLVCAAAREFFQ